MADLFAVFFGFTMLVGNTFFLVYFTILSYKIYERGGINVGNNNDSQEEK